MTPRTHKQITEVDLSHWVKKDPYFALVERLAMFEAKVLSRLLTGKLSLSTADSIITVFQHELYSQRASRK